MSLLFSSRYVLILIILIDEKLYPEFICGYTRLLIIYLKINFSEF
jgi:hypothetical protein